MNRPTALMLTTNKIKGPGIKPGPLNVTAFGNHGRFMHPYTTVKMFSYGMNTEKVSMQLRCKYAKVIGPGTLVNHRIDFRYNLDVKPHEGEKVEGVLWEIAASDLETLDQVEGYPLYYDRNLRYIICNRSLHNAYVYFMHENERLMEPDPAYLKRVIEGYWQHNLDYDQIYSALSRVKQYDSGQPIQAEQDSSAEVDAS